MAENKTITSRLSELGLPRKEKGTLYIASCVVFLLSGEVSAEPLHVWTLYEKVAEHYHTAPSNVESAIRHSLKKRPDAKDDHITNKAFILRAYDIFSGAKAE